MAAQFKTREQSDEDRSAPHRQIRAQPESISQPTVEEQGKQLPKVQFSISRLTHPAEQEMQKMHF